VLYFAYLKSQAYKPRQILTLQAFRQNQICQQTSLQTFYLEGRHLYEPKLMQCKWKIISLGRINVDYKTIRVAEGGLILFYFNYDNKTQE
jgi:hypothetical protein